MSSILEKILEQNSRAVDVAKQQDTNTATNTGEKYSANKDKDIDTLMNLAGLKVQRGGY